MRLSPLVLFAYNRPDHLRRTLASLRANPLAAQTDLYAFVDGPRTAADAPAVAAVRAQLDALTGFRRVTVRAAPTNRGLAPSVIAGVTEVIERLGAAIVIEDDLLVSADFLDFMNRALKFYRYEKRIFSISGYRYPLAVPPDYPHEVCLLPRASSWGWATWADRWAAADWEVAELPALARNAAARAALARGGEDLYWMLLKQRLGKISSWAVRWGYAHYRHRAYGLFPTRSKVENIGNDRSGVHSPRTDRFRSGLSDAPPALAKDLPVDPRLVAQLQSFFQLSPYRRLINTLTLRP